MPLSRYGLCDALMTAARSNLRVAISSGAAGVGRTPPRNTSPPADATPAASAASSISPDSRVSRMRSTLGCSHSDLLDGRPAQRERELAGEQLTGDAADAIRAEQPPSHAWGLEAA